MIEGLDDNCPACGRRSGDHTLDEWAACLGESGTALPFTIPDDDSAALLNENIRQRFNLDPGTLVADNVVVYAATLDFSSGTVSGKVPALIHDFSTSAGGKLVTVAKIVFMGGDPEQMRQYGKLARDSANAAANRAEGR